MEFRDKVRLFFAVLGLVLRFAEEWMKIIRDFSLSIRKRLLDLD